MTGMHDIDTKHTAQARDFHREQLSAMIDDALSADESRFLLRRMEHDDELADCWQRWQFYGDAMRGGAGRALPADFAQRVGRAIADDAADDIAAAEAAPIRVARGGRLLYWGGGAALAASVALAALFGTRLDAPVAGDLQVAGVSSPVTPSLPAVPAPQAPTPVPAPGVDVGTAGAAAATLVAAAAAAEQRRDTKPRIMAASRALSDRTGLAARSAPAPRAEGRARRDERPLQAIGTAPTQTYAAADVSRAAPSISASPAKSWPRALVPGASQSDEVVVTYPIETTRRSPFQPDFVPLIDASQAEQAGRAH
jgi:negative regulator of sigma E activity